ncbi:hypothetical protein MOR12E_24485 [Methylobacterium oryzae]
MGQLRNLRVFCKRTFCNAPISAAQPTLVAFLKRTLQQLSLESNLRQQQIYAAFCLENRF